MARPPAALSACVVLAALGLGTAPAAVADMSATVEVARQSGVSGSDFDLQTFDIATGVRTSPGVNTTTGDEFHPSIARNRLAFERTSSGAISIIVRDQGTGQQANVFNGFDSAIDKPNDPALAPDASLVVTGHPKPDSNPGRAGLVSTSLGNFPNGPFAHTAVTEGGCCDTQTFAPLVLASDPLDVLFDIAFGDPPPANAIERMVGGSSSFSIFPSDNAVHAAMAPGGSIVVFEIPIQAAAHFKQPGLYVVPVGQASSGPWTRLPAPMNASVAGDREPTLSADGRYLAFVRQGGDGGDELFVWDSETQLLLDPNGIDLGRIVPSSRASFLGQFGSIALVQHFVLKTTSIRPGGLVTFGLINPSLVGIIVQKVVGHTRVFGRRAPKLRFLGRVPLGHFKRGRRHIRWNRELNGRRLPPGLYQVTVRSVTRRGGVRDLGHPALVRIKRRR